MRAAIAALLLVTLAGCATLPGSEAGPGGSDRVVRVIDGDTVELQELGKTRLIGVDTPEVYGGVECFGRAASAYTKRRLPAGTKVTYELGAERTDRYERTLAYLRLDGRMLNEDLAAEGYATALAIAPNVDYAERFENAAAQARSQRRGLWGACGPD